MLSTRGHDDVTVITDRPRIVHDGADQYRGAPQSTAAAHPRLVPGLGQAPGAGEFCQLARHTREGAGSMTGKNKTALLGPLNGEALVPGGHSARGPAEPPPVAEQFSIFGKQKRRLLAVTIFTLSLGSLYGIWAVFSKSWMSYPWIGMLVILVPWSVYTLILTLVRPSITAASHDQVFADTSQDLASVDIFIPVCGERLEVLANTFRHVRGLAWRGPWRVYVLDDGASREVHRLCREHGFNYIVRPNRGEYRESLEPEPRTGAFRRRVHRGVRRGFCPGAGVPRPASPVFQRPEGRASCRLPSISMWTGNVSRTGCSGTAGRFRRCSSPTSSRPRRR